MASRLETLEAEAMDLPPEERVKLADRLIATVFGDNDIEEAWASEVGRRVAEIEAGRIQMIPAADAIARAFVDIAKLRDYCLDSPHPEGRHKARVFRSALDLTEDDAEELRQSVLDQVAQAETVPGETDEYGSRYLVDFELTRGSKKARVRTTWIVRRNEDFPRLATCYVL